MAYHGPSYGLDAELKAKQDAKYDKNLEREVLEWIQALIGVTITDPEGDLKNGITLCK
jgi:hypothetical protein